MDNKLPRLVCLGNFTVDDVYLPDGSVVPECLAGRALRRLRARLWEPSVKFIAPLSPDLPERAYQAMHAAGFDRKSCPSATRQPSETAFITMPRAVAAGKSWLRKKSFTTCLQPSGYSSKLLAGWCLPHTRHDPAGARSVAALA